MSEEQIQKITFIFAGSYDQFLSWCYENKINPHNRWYRYLSRIEHLMGLNDFEVVFYGTPEHRKDFFEIYDEIYIRRIHRDNIRRSYAKA